MPPVQPLLLDLPDITRPPRPQRAARTPPASAPPPAPEPVQPLPVPAARARGHAAGEASARRADRVRGTPWTMGALEAMRVFVFAREPAQDFTIEQARLGMGDAVPAPPDQRAWGHVTRMALAEGLIEPSGYAPSASSNGSPMRTYRRRA